MPHTRWNGIIYTRSGPLEVDFDGFLLYYRPRANNLILFMSIQPARNPLGKFVGHWWRHKRSTVKQAEICSQLPSYWLYFWTTKHYKFDTLPWLHRHVNVSCHRVTKGFDHLTYTMQLTNYKDKIFPFHQNLSIWVFCCWEFAGSATS